MSSRPPFVYRALVAFVHFVVDVFFRENAVEGRTNVPHDRGGLLVAWHPNGLIDPALILAEFPGHIVFGARHGLLRWPILGRLFRALGTVPIYRSGDDRAMSEEDRRAANEKSLNALADALASGSFAALFPEGHSHDQSYVSDLKSGAARLYYRALARAGDRPPPVIIPVGLHYDRKALFRSDVLIVFHEPLTLTPHLLPPTDGAETADEEYARVHRLTDAIEEVLIQVVHATDDWHLHTLMHRARTLLRAEAAARTGTPLNDDSIVERRLGFAQIWHGYQAHRRTHPEEIAALRDDLTHYHRRLRALRLDDADLDEPPRHRLARDTVALFARTVAVYMLLPPLLLFGLLANGPVHLLIGAAARRFAGAAKDVATVKILVGGVLYPLAWLTAGVLAALAHARLHAALPDLPDTPLLTGLLVTVLAFVSGVLVLKFTEWERLTRQRLRAYVARQRRRDLIAELCATRAALYERFLALRDGLDLPDAVTDADVLTPR